jgi:hypothetical protein
VNPEALSPRLSDLWDTAVTRAFTKQRIRVYGWIDGGYTYSSAGDGLLSIVDGRAGTAPTPNRFGNEVILNGAWLITDRLPSKEGWDWGFRADFYAGSDAALLHPSNRFGPYSRHLATDYRQAYFSFHAPALSKGGVDVQIGRQNLPLGYETLMGPYRPLYSQTYYWIYFQVAATAAMATWHATDRLDLLGGVVLNYNTIYKLRGRAPAYIAKGAYSFGADKKTMLRRLSTQVRSQCRLHQPISVRGRPSLSLTSHTTGLAESRRSFLSMVHGMPMTPLHVARQRGHMEQTRQRPST